jgi:tRNA pseudouridine55 synthase
MLRISEQHGVVVVDKPRGPTSHDIVAQARRLYGTRHVGHAGTLDPLATGVLLLLIGEARKLSGYMTAARKRYRASVAFGTATDTLDADGQVTVQQALLPGWLHMDRLEQALADERARTSQVPPAFSSIKVAGQTAHKLSRKGVEVELGPREVAVEELKLVQHSDFEVSVELTVSKGYYVRSLARDLGARLGVPAHLSALRRLASGGFTLEESCAWPCLTPPTPLGLAKAAERSLPTAQLTPAGEQRARLGQPLTSEHFASPPPLENDLVCAWLSSAGELVALGRRDETIFRVIRGFVAAVAPA